MWILRFALSDSGLIDRALCFQIEDNNRVNGLMFGVSYYRVIETLEFKYFWTGSILIKLCFVQS